MTSKPMRCRLCNSELSQVFLDLGMTPLCQTHITKDQLNDSEIFYPLVVYLCNNCYLVQVPEAVNPREIFSEYAYFSSYSDTLLKHSLEYSKMIINRFNLTGKSQVIEIASNDGYLLQYFIKNHIPSLGIEPAANIAEKAKKYGVPTLVEFFNCETANKLKKKGIQADLLIGNNVLAQIPALHDFVEGMKLILKPRGVITLEFPHLLNMIKNNQFDTIYHEHYSYFSFYTIEKILASHNLRVFDVQEISTHGGSLRLFVCHDNTNRKISNNVVSLAKKETDWGVSNLNSYLPFKESIEKTKIDILQFFINAKSLGKKVVGYGAPGKGNTLLNFCGIKKDFLDYTVDKNPYKQGKFTPGTHIPIFSPEKILETKPDFVFILPWNLKDEIIEQNSYIKNWGGKFVVPIPKLEIY